MSLEELIRACATHGHESDWQEFVRRFQPLIAGVAMRTAQRCGNRSAALVDDLVQDTFMKLCSDPPHLLKVFRSDTPEAFYGYIKVVTTNLVLDHFRAARSQRRDMQKEEPLETSGTVMATGPGDAAHMERTVLLAEVDAALKNVTDGPTKERDCTIFWLYYRQGLTAESISQVSGFQLTEKGVEALLHRLSRKVRERLAGPPSPLGV